MPDATNTDDYMGTEGAKSAVKVVQEKIDSGSSAEEVVRSLADNEWRYSVARGNDGKTGRGAD